MARRAIVPLIWARGWRFRRAARIRSRAGRAPQCWISMRLPVLILPCWRRAAPDTLEVASRGPFLVCPPDRRFACALIFPPLCLVLLVLKRLSLGLGLIVATAAILLYSDQKSRISARKAAANAALGASAASKVFRIALVQHASQQALDDGVRGMLGALKARGFEDGKNLKVTRYNAEGDIATANSIAKNITTGDFDLLLTSSTLSMQTVANANKATKIPHVFGLVTDPYGAGVGINRTNHLDHPAHLAGYGTLQPVAACFTLARQMRPELKKVGVAWNPGEANSEAQVKLARKFCGESGMELMESTVDNSSGVFEAVNALVARGAEAIWVGGDVMVMTAFESAVNAAKRGGVPVFTVIPPHAEKGALFDLGADYVEVGRVAGDLAADILSGRNPATVPIDNLVPEVLLVNRTAAQNLRQAWRIPDDIWNRANVAIDEQGKHVRTNAAPAKAASTYKPANVPPGKKWNIHLIEFVQVLDVEEAEKGVLEGLKGSGLVEGRDYTVKRVNAHGDMATLSSMIDAAMTDQADMIVTLSTPTLQAAIRRGGKTPIIFTYCASAIAAGAGKSETDHLPNVTGIVTAGAYDEQALVVRECLPQAKRLGTLFAPSEVNMVFHKDKVAEALKKLGMELVAFPAETSLEVSDAATALCQQNIDAICQIPGNLTAVAFPSIVRAAQTARVPVFASQMTQAHAGAAVTVAREHHAAGIETGELAARVMRGTSPAEIPFKTFTTTKIILNRNAIRQFGLTIPPSLEKRASQVIGN